MDKYSFGIKLLAVGAAVVVAAYFGLDISNWVGGVLGSVSLPTTP